jgi:ammonia channel protein AmtB
VIIYAGTAPSHDSGGAAALGVLVLLGQRNRLDVGTEVERIFDLFWRKVFVTQISTQF